MDGGRTSGSGPWTRITHWVNVLIWRLPLPRRVLVRLSVTVYRNPPMSASRAAETFEALQAAGVEATVMGGWGADALLGEQRRVHRDLDLTVCEDEMEAALRALSALGYTEWFRLAAPPLGDLELAGAVIALRDRRMRVVELHPVRPDSVDRAQGTIGGQPVSCFSAEQQIRALSGYRGGSRRRSDTRRANLDAAEHSLRNGESAGSAGGGALPE